MDNATLISLVIAIVALGGVLLLLAERKRSRKLKSRFGVEYDRTLGAAGNVGSAESILSQRQRRVAKYRVRPLTRDERDRYAIEWRQAQTRFVDDPRAAVASADFLVREAMSLRGYPNGSFEKQAEDLSVDHAAVLGEYRMAHDIALRSEYGQATTEELRLAMQYYRIIFEEVAETRAA